MTILWPVADTTKQLILILEILREFQFYFKSASGFKSDFF